MGPILPGSPRCWSTDHPSRGGSPPRGQPGQDIDQAHARSGVALTEDNKGAGAAITRKAADCDSHQAIRFSCGRTRSELMGPSEELCPSLPRLAP